MDCPLVRASLTGDEIRTTKLMVRLINDFMMYLLDASFVVR